MSILQMQHTQGASNLDLHRYFGCWRIASSCMEPLRTDWSALVRLAPEAYSGSLKSTHPSLPSVSATTEGGHQKKRKRPKEEFVFALTFQSSYGSAEHLTFFSYKKSEWLKTWSKIRAWACPQTSNCPSDKKKEIAARLLRGGVRGWVQNTALWETSHPCSKWQHLKHTFKKFLLKFPRALPRKLFLNPWPASACCLFSSHPVAHF